MKLDDPAVSNDWKQQLRYPEVGITIEASLNTSQEQLRRNIALNIQRGLPQVWPHAEQDTVIALCAGGPSLLDTLDKLREVQEKGAKVVALANVAHVLKRQGIHVSAQVLLDAKPRNAEFVMLNPACTYFVASQCDPSVFNTLKDHVAYIWHAVNNAEEFELIHEHYPEGWVPIQGGPTIALRALRLLHILGYHRFEVFGMDSCLLNDHHHAYEQPDADDDRAVTIGCNGREFQVTGWMISQAMEFMKMVKVFGQNWQMVVHGDGLIAHLIRTGGK